jgi:hypothetical protein
MSKPGDHPWSIGGSPGFLFLSDKDQYLAHLLGVSRYGDLRLLLIVIFGFLSCMEPLGNEWIGVQVIYFEAKNHFWRWTHFPKN